MPPEAPLFDWLASLHPIAFYALFAVGVVMALIAFGSAGALCWWLLVWPVARLLGWDRGQGVDVGFGVETKTPPELDGEGEGRA